MSRTTSRTRFTSTGRPGPNRKPIEDLEFEADVTPDGLAMFENIPVGVHKISVPAFRDYNESQTVAKMVEAAEDGEFRAYVEISKTGLTVTKVKLEWPTHWIEDDSYEGTQKLKRAKQEVSVTAILIEKSKHVEGEGEGDSDRDISIDEDSEEEYDQEFVFKASEDIYELPLKGGHYMIVIRYPLLQQ